MGINDNGCKRDPINKIKFLFQHFTLTTLKFERKFEDGLKERPKPFSYNKLCIYIYIPEIVFDCIYKLIFCKYCKKFICTI